MSDHDDDWMAGQHELERMREEGRRRAAEEKEAMAMRRQEEPNVLADLAAYAHAHGKQPSEILDDFDRRLRKLEGETG